MTSYDRLLRAAHVMQTAFGLTDTSRPPAGLLLPVNPTGYHTPEGTPLMPKYNVSVTKTVTTIYDDVEIEADDADEAADQAEGMAQDGKLSVANEDDEPDGETSYDTEVNPVETGASASTEPGKAGSASS